MGESPSPLRQLLACVHAVVSRRFGTVGDEPGRRHPAVVPLERNDPFVILYTDCLDSLD